MLVIGATGMMGSHIVPLLLEKGYAVDGVALDDVKSNHPNLRYIKTNAYDENVLRELLKNDLWEGKLNKVRAEGGLVE